METSDYCDTTERMPHDPSHGSMNMEHVGIIISYLKHPQSRVRAGHVMVPLPNVIYQKGRSVPAHRSFISQIKKHGWSCILFNIVTVS